MTGFMFGIVIGFIGGFGLAAFLAVSSRDREGRL